MKREVRKWAGENLAKRKWDTQHATRNTIAIYVKPKKERSNTILQWKIEINYKPELFDAIGEGINQDIADLGITGVKRVRSSHLYWLDGELTEAEVDEICRSLLADTIAQEYRFQEVAQGMSSRAKRRNLERSDLGENDWIVEVSYKPGVTDAVGNSVVKGIRDLGIEGVKTAKTGQEYAITGKIDQGQLERISKQLLANEVIQNFMIA